MADPKNKKTDEETKVKQPWEKEEGPDATAATPPAEAEKDQVPELTEDELQKEIAILTGKLAEANITPAMLTEAAKEVDLDDTNLKDVYEFLREKYAETIAPAELQEQAPLALVNLVSQGMSMKKAKEHLKLD
jgi:hypothetical protein